MRTGRCLRCDNCYAWTGRRATRLTCMCGEPITEGHVEVGEPIIVYWRGFPGDRQQSCVEAQHMLRPDSWLTASAAREGEGGDHG